MIAMNPRETVHRETEREFVVHPMFDVPEVKRSGEGLGLMEMTPRVRLVPLRPARIPGPHVRNARLPPSLDQAGVFSHHIVR